NYVFTRRSEKYAQNYVPVKRHQSQSARQETYRRADPDEPPRENSPHRRRPPRLAEPGSDDTASKHGRRPRRATTTAPYEARRNAAGRQAGRISTTRTEVCNAETLSGAAISIPTNLRSARNR